MPRSLQLALSAKDYSDTIVVAKPPPWVQNVVFGVLAPIARARGLKPTHEEYLTSDVVGRAGSGGVGADRAGRAAEVRGLMTSP
jgi:hypothetical protein